MEEMKTFNNAGTGIFSITVYAEKIGTKHEKTKVKMTQLHESTSSCEANFGCC